MKKLIAVFALVVLLLCGCSVNGEGDTPLDTSPDAEYDDVLRLHIIANSDSDEDQQVKLEVRDSLLAHMEENGVQDKAEALRFAKDNIDGFEAIAQSVLAQHGFDYGARGEVGVFDFPARDYGGASYPAGKYDALKIVLGEGSGQNWWCVMFPPLCFVDVGYAEKMDEQTMKDIVEDTTVQVEYDSLFAQWWRAIFGK
jgi:stage II sporulation protein R